MKSKNISLIALTLALPLTGSRLNAAPSTPPAPSAMAVSHTATPANPPAATSNVVSTQNSAAPTNAPKPTTAGATSAAIVLKDPVAIVDGVPISKNDLEKAFKEAVTASGVNPAMLTADQKLQGYNQILDAMIMEKLVDKKSTGLEVSDTDLNAEIEKIQKQFPNKEAFEAELKKSAQTQEQFKANLKKSMRQTKWIKSQMQGKDEISDADAQKFYNENIKQFSNPDMVKATHILFLVPAGASEKVVKEKEAAAKAAIERANKGEDFSKLAVELSEEPGAKQRKGDLGFFSKEQMVPEFANAAFSQKVGTVSETPVRTKFGFHVIKVTEKKPAGTATLVEVKPSIVSYLQNKKRRELFKSTMQQLRQAAKIESFLPPPPAPKITVTPAVKPAGTSTNTATTGATKTAPAAAPASSPTPAQPVTPAPASAPAAK
ncbi:MAG: peptidylprolyl isomerase [Chthoniobacterales bacterium]|nr:peptidylprolyl isomerase [Chthoniobacterales bacterium]